MRVTSLADLPDANVSLFDTSPTALADDRWRPAARTSRRAFGRWRYGPAAFKLDLAVEGGVPWRAEVCREAGVVHVGGSLEEIVAAEAAVAIAAGCRTDRSCWSASNISPIRAGRPATSIRSGLTRTCQMAIRTMPATRSSADRAVRPGRPRPDRRPLSDVTAVVRGLQPELRRRRHRQWRKQPASTDHAAAPRRRSVLHGDPGRLPVLSGDAAGCRGSRDVRPQRRAASASIPRPSD